MSSDSPLSSRPSSEAVQHSALAPASLWCSPKSARNFIAQLQSSAASDLGRGGGGPLTLAPGETASVQVPTSTQASAIFWEFVTEQGEVGFGLSFQKQGLEDSIEQLLPVTRRDCSKDLVLGSHQYKDQGTYFLDFDNSHSITPSVVYYKVFYQNKVSQ